MMPKHTYAKAQFPTKEDIASYNENGFVVARGLLSPDEIDDALFGIDRYYAGERDWSLPVSGGFLDWKAEHADGLRINDYVSLQNTELRDLVMQPALGAAFSALSGAPVIRLFHDQLISKSPSFGSDTAVGWHVDGAYWKTCTSSRMLTAWIPLVPYTEEMGPIHFIPGSHLWEGFGWMTTFNEKDLDALLERVAAEGQPTEPVAVMLEPGDVSFHHARTIHGSPPNRGATPRVALTVHVQDGDNRYTSFEDCRGAKAVHVNDALCRQGTDGLPDYSDDEICPQVWPAAWRPGPMSSSG